MIHGFRNEEWKEIKFDSKIDPLEKWKISNFGRVLNCKEEEEKLHTKNLINGYPAVPVRQLVNRKKTSRFVHKIVAEHFLEKEEEDKYVIHLDYDKLNNHVSNLKWATKREKELHQFKNPVFIEAVKNKKVNYKLDEGKVKIIKRKLASTKSSTRLKMIAKQFGVSDMQIHRIKTGENWGHVKID
ncbi:hypothetical protein FHR24_000266 [Wenyingzhuangia heitensis]|uniref:NUMOD4 motif-containing protein n=1 Tax=Wenyingzhuangia heitensis TaxID=1487859 RepID=A0ABX0U4V1_9FLAO|nr:HNH endonuclease [Wenyingzhuangia heitensis]NIJ43827.1 hypothetical protein [Wenyingzhuangia heitensis]